MHPFMYESIVRERQAALIRQADHQRLVKAARELKPSRVRTRRPRFGWWRRLRPALWAAVRRAAGVSITTSVRPG